MNLTRLTTKYNMTFQTRCHRYLQNIQATQSTSAATPELSLFPHLQTFLEGTAVDHFGRDTITFTQEPRRLDQIGRPDFISMDGLLPIGYIEAEAYGRDLDALTGHAAEQNARFIENLDNFVLTNFVEFRLYTNGQLRATANITDTPENLEVLLERFLDAGGVQISSPETLARYLARRTRELQTQIATTLVRGTLHTPERDELLTIHRRRGTPKIEPVSRRTLLSRRFSETGDERYLHSGRHRLAPPERPDRDAPHGVCCQKSPRGSRYPLLRDLPR